MRTVTFQSVLDGAAARIGLDPTQTIQPSTASALTEYINTRVRFAWEAYKWPELSAIERRAFRQPWATGKSYAANEEVYYGGNYYRARLAHTSSSSNEPDDATNGATNWSIADAAITSVGVEYSALTDYKVGDEVIFNGKLYRMRVDAAAGVSPTNTTNWSQVFSYTDFIRSIDFEQSFTLTSATTNATEIGEVLYVYAQDPRVARYAERVNFWITDSGIIVGSTQFTASTPNTVYIEFTKRPSFYSTNSGDADFPRVLSEYVKYGSAADALREDGQFEKATYMDSLAVDALQKELDIIEVKQGQTRLRGNRRDLYPANPMQRGSVSPTGLAIERAQGNQAVQRTIG